ncbi:hypothetical protein [Sorangium sp. So ce131]|uniref:hypothetical protein n=1 Tax=Sorangium sp. So ce131 TaxID=3133282 RepID=UPI003F5E703E
MSLPFIGSEDAGYRVGRIATASRASHEHGVLLRLISKWLHEYYFRLSEVLAGITAREERIQRKGAKTQRRKNTKKILVCAFAPLR